MNAPVGIELFCGCGGISTGFLNAGVHIAAGFDIDKRAVEAYEYNHRYRSSRGFAVDLSQMSGKELLQLAGIPRIDALVGGPPCQPFSIVGKRKGAEDKRADLVHHFLRIASELSPQAVFFENVPNLASIDAGAHLNRVITAFERLGYATHLAVVPSADFGVAQIRRRLLLVAAKEVGRICLPKATHAASQCESRSLKPYVTAREVLDDLPPAGEYGETHVYNHEPTDHTPDMLARFARLGVGEREKRSFHDRIHPDRPSYTLRAGTGNFSPLRPIHYKYDRVVTVRESARLQGFSDEFIWPDWIPRLQQYRQVGNAVPPPVAEAVAKSLALQLSWRTDANGFNGNPASRQSAITMTDEERSALRRSRIRGASLGKAIRRA